MQDGLKASVYIPLNVIKTATKVWNPMVELAKVGNINSKSDLQVEYHRTFFLKTDQDSYQFNTP